VLVCGVRSVWSGWPGWSGRTSTPAKTAIVLGAGWAIAPPILLFAVSQVLPMWDVHYLLFSLPGLALLLAGLCPSLDGESGLRSGIAMSTAVLLIAALGLSDQVAYRDPATGHDEDLIAASDYLGEQVQPGDAVLFVPAELRVLTETSPQSFAGLDDVAVDQSPLEADNLVGTPIAAADLPRVLLPRQRVWLVRGLFAYLPAPVTVQVEDRTLALLSADFDEAQTRTITDVQVTLYTRRS
jgi:mannosyltransferase